jgi:hypothetical protein
VDGKGRLGVSGWLGIFKATALVNCDINQNCSWLHLLYQRIGDKLWRLGSWDKHRSNYQVGILDGTLNFKTVARDGSKPSGIQGIQLAQTI